MKKKRQLTLNQKVVLDRVKEQLRTGMKVNVSAATKGIYSQKNTAVASNITKLPEFQILLEEHLPDDHIQMRHRELLDKRDTEVVKLGFGKKAKWELIDKGPETNAVKAALDMAYKIKNKYPNPATNVAVQVNLGESKKDYA